jgi:hypothetical protein
MIHSLEGGKADWAACLLAGEDGFLMQSGTSLQAPTGEQPTEELNSGGGVVEPDEVMERGVHPSPRSELVKGSRIKRPALLPALQQRAPVRLTRLQSDRAQDDVELAELLLAASSEARDQGTTEASSKLMKQKARGRIIHAQISYKLAIYNKK